MPFEFPLNVTIERQFRHAFERYTTLGHRCDDLRFHTLRQVKRSQFRHVICTHVDPGARMGVLGCNSVRIFGIGLVGLLGIPAHHGQILTR